MELNEQQSKAKDLIVDWFKHKTSTKQLFVLNGPAGTGKSTTISYVINEILKIRKDQVAFATPTGKAASVLLQKGSDATTIHRLIYSPYIKENENIVNGKSFKTRKILFSKKKSIGNYKLIVLDEISMVGKNIMDDLISYGIPILATGDDAQLPAVCSENNGLLIHPDYTLTEVVRQAKDDPILSVATMARLGQNISEGNYGNDVTVISHKNLSDSKLKELLLSADQVICGKNVTKYKLNSFVRQCYGYTTKLPVDGEKVICDLNNYEIMFGDKFPLVNGMICYVKDFKIIDEKLKLATVTVKLDFLKDEVKDVLIDYSVFETNEYLYDKHQNIFLLYDGSYAIEQKVYKYQPGEDKTEYMKKIKNNFVIKRMAINSFMVNQFEYGYVCSCHKSQGSEWNTVVVVDESEVFKKDKNKWLYTACTRAKKKLIIIR